MTTIAANRKKTEKIPKDCMPCCGGCSFIQIEPKEDEGYCRRYPARIIVVNDEAYSAIPVVRRDGWCGEFSRRSN